MLKLYYFNRYKRFNVDNMELYISDLDQASMVRVKGGG